MHLPGRGRSCTCPVGAGLAHARQGDRISRGHPVPKTSDQAYLLTDQYQNSSNLDARNQLHARFSINEYGWQRWVLDQFGFAPESHILELGCGPCYLWLENLDRIPEGWDITLSDFSPGMLQKARQNLCDYLWRFKFEVIDAQAIPFEDGSFDGVIANHMLYHVPDRAQALAEIRRVLRPGGCLYATTVGRAHLRELGELVSGFAPDYDPWGERGNPTELFLLENGLDQLVEWFPQVALRRYEDDLIVTEAAPLVAYALSMTTIPASVVDNAAKFAEFVEQELASRDVIRITKDSGVFEAFRSGVGLGSQQIPF